MEWAKEARDKGRLVESPEHWSTKDRNDSMAVNADLVGIGQWRSDHRGTYRVDLVAKEWTEGATYEWILWYLKEDGTVGVMYPDTNGG